MSSSMRNFMEGLRDSGVDTGGPKPLGPKDKELFSIKKLTPMAGYTSH